MERELTELTEKRIEKLFNCLRESPNVTKAAKKAGIPREYIYELKRLNEDFNRRFEEARNLGIEAIEDKAWERTEESDIMLLAMLKANKPDKYGDKKQIDLSGTVNVNMVVNVEKP